MDYISKANEYFKYLHENPEISWKEFNTTNKLAEWIEKEGLVANRYSLGTTGVWTEIGTGSPKIGIRVDIDALWQEVKGEMKANHSCGHDAHMTIGLTTLLMLKDKNLPCTIRFIFQPAEEVGGGALKTIEEGLIDDLDYLYGLHLRPIQELSNGYFSSSIEHGASKCIYGEIIGENAHAARPHLGTNVIETGMSIMDLINTIHHNPMIPASVKMTSFNAGSVKEHNTIPGKAVFTIDARAQNNETMKYITEYFYRIIKGTEISHAVKIDVKEIVSLKAATVHEEARNNMSNAIKNIVGEEFLINELKTPGGEDFHMYGYKFPNLKTTMLGVGCDLIPGLHHPEMNFNKEQFVPAAKILESCVKESLISYYKNSLY